MNSAEGRFHRFGFIVSCAKRRSDLSSELNSRAPCQNVLPAIGS